MKSVIFSTGNPSPFFLHIRQRFAVLFSGKLIGCEHTVIKYTLS